MLKARYLIGFTGHRSGFDETLVRAALKSVLADLQKRATDVGGSVDLYSSVAEGADLVCVEEARDLGLPVHLLLPLPENEFKKDFSSVEAWGRSCSQLDLARQKPGRDSVRLVPGELQRPDCYFDQAIHMLDAVDVVVAVWDGQPAQGLGGTEQIIAQAKAMGTSVINIDATTGGTEVIGDLALCFAPDAMVTDLNKAAQNTVLRGAETADTADHLQKCLDKIAKVEAARFRPSLVVIILLHGLAALLAAIVTFKLAAGTPWEKSKWAFTFTELVLVVAALWISWLLHHKHTQERWIRCRFACEVVRGLRFSVPLTCPLHPAIALHDPKWRRFSLSAGLLVNEHQTTSNPQALRDRYITTRLSETDKEEGQIYHYRFMEPKALWWWGLTGGISKWSAVLAPPFVLWSLVNKLKEWHLDEKPLYWPFVVLLPIALPLVAGVASGIRQALDAGRRKERYPEMAARLTVLRTHLQGLETRASIAHTVAQTEETLLDELREWQLTATTTGH